MVSRLSLPILVLLWALLPFHPGRANGQGTFVALDGSAAQSSGRPVTAALTEARMLLRSVRPWDSGEWSSLATEGSREASERIATARALLAECERAASGRGAGLGDVSALQLGGVQRALSHFLGEIDDPFEPALITGAREPLRVLDAFFQQPPATTEGAAEARLVQAEALADWIESVAVVVAAGAEAGRAPSASEVNRIIDAAAVWTPEHVTERLRAMALSEAARIGPRGERSIDLRLRTRSAIRVADAVAAYRTLLLQRVLPMATQMPGWSGSPAGHRAFARAVQVYLGEAVDPQFHAQQALFELQRLRSEIVLTIKSGGGGELLSAVQSEVSAADTDVAAFGELLAAVRSSVTEQAFVSDELLLLHASAIAKQLDAAHLRFVRTPVTLPYGLESAASPGRGLHLVPGDLASGVSDTIQLPAASARTMPASMLPVVLRAFGINGRLLALDRARAAGASGFDPMIDAFAEAWGLYAARRLADEDSGAGALLLLLAELDVAARWAADVMIHVQGASPADVRAMLAAHRAPLSDDPDRTVRDVLDHPGHASAVKPMELQLRAHHRAAQSRLGGALNERLFHEALLQGGPAAPGVLRARAVAWMDRLPIGLSFD